MLGKGGGRKGSKPLEQVGTRRGGRGRGLVAKAGNAALRPAGYAATFPRPRDTPSAPPRPRDSSV